MPPDSCAVPEQHTNLTGERGRMRTNSTTHIKTTTRQHHSPTGAALHQGWLDPPCNAHIEARKAICGTAQRIEEPSTDASGAKANHSRWLKSQFSFVEEEESLCDIVLGGLAATCRHRK